jgi:protein gp37
MGNATLIEWCDATWNPWYGCRHISPGCNHCYMYAWQKRVGWDPTVIQRSKTRFRDPLRWHEPKRIFSCSLSDFFIQEGDKWRPEAWAIMRQTPQHTYLILTKRPRRVQRCLPPDWRAGYPNVWLGVSVEDAYTQARRLPVLQTIPAVHRFVSIEPLLAPSAPLDLTGISWGDCRRGKWSWVPRDAPLVGVAYSRRLPASRRGFFL